MCIYIFARICICAQIHGQSVLHVSMIHVAVTCHNVHMYFYFIWWCECCCAYTYIDGFEFNQLFGASVQELKGVVLCPLSTQGMCKRVSRKPRSLVNKVWGYRFLRELAWSQNCV